MDDTTNVNTSAATGAQLVGFMPAAPAAPPAPASSAMDDAKQLLHEVHLWRAAERMGAFPHELRERSAAFCAEHEL